MRPFGITSGGVCCRRPSGHRRYDEETVRFLRANGESAGNTLRQTSIGGAVLPWQDVLHEGPVQAVSRPELLRVRATFLSDCGWGSRRAILSSLERRDRQFAEALQDGLQVVLWFEHDLYDQLQLLDALALAREVGESPELIVVGSFPGRPSFRGLGELSVDELETLWPTRRTATPEALNAAATAWDAFRAPEPTALADARVETHEGEPLPAPPPLSDGQVFARLPLRLTAEGKRVLRGESDRVDLLGVDRWIGGSHVTPENTWRWDRAGHRLLAPPTSGADETGPE